MTGVGFGVRIERMGTKDAAVKAAKGVANRWLMRHGLSTEHREKATRLRDEGGLSADDAYFASAEALGYEVPGSSAESSKALGSQKPDSLTFGLTATQEAELRIRPPVKAVRTVEWCFQHVRDTTLDPLEAPDLGTLRYLEWIRRSGTNESKFYEKWMDRMIPTRNQLEQRERMSDDGSDTLVKDFGEMIVVAQGAGNG